MFPSAQRQLQQHQEDLMAYRWLEEQKREQARRREAATTRTQFHAATERAWSLLEYGRPLEARRVLDGVLARHPDEPWALFLYAVSLLRTGEYAGAESVFSSLLERSPGDHTSAYYLGLTRERQGRLAEARQMYRRALDLNPDFKAARARLDPAFRSRGHGQPAPRRTPESGRALLLVIIGAAAWVALAMVR